MQRMAILLTGLMLVASFIWLMPVGAATRYADPAFEAQWNKGQIFVGAHAVLIGNRYGPLSTAREGQQERYKDAPGGQRLVQYFDKGRLELGPNGAVTTGLLTVEMKSGQMQVGDNAFEVRPPARVNLAGDPGSSGPTYADLALMPEVRPYTGNGTAYPYLWDGKQLVLLHDQKEFPFPIFTSSGNYSRLIDSPGGRYHQWVPDRFALFLGILAPFNGTANRDITTITGYPISPFFFAQTTIGGKQTWVLIQAFERYVLTFNPNNDDDSQVEFGNIGQHYYRWRYEGTQSGSPARVSN